LTVAPAPKLPRAARWELADQLASNRPVDVQDGPVVAGRTFYARYVKRLVDIVVAAIAIVVTTPLNLVFAVVTLIDVGRPVLFRQTRIGRDGEAFTIVKFRNMRIELDENGDLAPPEQRVTRWGKFMRAASLDELLSFWLVLTGRMSLIGPRPLVPEYTPRMSPRHASRLRVRPGLECPPRTIRDHDRSWQEQFEDDVWYVQHVSFLTDCLLAWRLVQLTLDPRHASARANVARTSFMGYDAAGRAVDFDDLFAGPAAGRSGV
jgi:lipopolysaccharide/colanic/teichoic acid biosynthesis glycosyltransferase